MRSTDLNTGRFLVLAFGSAIFLRLLLMPFFAHVDLFSEYRRVFYVIENDLYFANSQRIVTYYIEMIFAALSKLFIPSSETIFYLADPHKSTASLPDYFMFLQDPYIYRYLFIIKIPYLIFDIATAIIIWRFSSNTSYQKLALLLWLFNPMTLYATYIFGRFEVISLFFLALTAYQLKQERLIIASFCFALSLHCREINLMFAPFFLMALINLKSGFLKNSLVVIISALIIGLIYALPDWFLRSFGYDDLFIDPDSAATHNPIGKLLSLGYYWFYPIIFGLAATAIYAWEIAKRSHAERFILASALTLLVYFAFNTHSIHYASWLVLFPVLSIHYGKQVTLPMLVTVGLWIVLWLFKTDGGVFTPFLAAPLSSEFIGIGHFPTYFSRNLATPNVDVHLSIQILRSLFATAMAFMCYRLVRRQNSGAAL